jgi:hypothetical protein
MALTLAAVSDTDFVHLYMFSIDREKERAPLPMRA